MKKTILLGCVAIVLLFVYFQIKGDCLALDEETRWNNVGGTMIRIVTKDKFAFIGIDIYRSEYRIEDSSNIVFTKKDELCVGDDISIDGRTWKIKDILSVHDRVNFSETGEETEKKLMRTVEETLPE